MKDSKLRRQIAFEAARLMYSRQETEYFQAKIKASRRTVRGWVKPADLPSNAEVRDQIQVLTRLHETDADARHGRLGRMRLRALWWLRQLDAHHAKLIGSVLTGSVRDGSDIDIHVFGNHPDTIADEVDSLGFACQVVRKQVVKDGQPRVFTHIRIDDEFPIELTVYPLKWIGHRFKSSITGKAIERASASQLEKLLVFAHDYDAASLSTSLQQIQGRPDRFQVFQALMVPLENVVQSPRWHPEGDALYHSLQVFGLAKDESPYDEEFLLAALLHDIGKAIDPDDHSVAALEALDGYISPRTAWLIAHHMEAHKIHDHTIGARRRRRLASHPWFEDLLLLGDCDRGGRVAGVSVDTLQQALDYIESIEEMFGGDPVQPSWSPHDDEPIR
ncbi:HD domain-containing protein [Crateriforma conspicua]|uniref:HD domain-containing protein n=1 Tax=Crateriforma conspicua TaxID=2527996 RepID=A0A5C5Y4X5_9PLAN|nr:HD domain-containing protein [Crateriforma conspicua]QDV65312.1 hypothetical protein Mal65_44820 [Crateriforma conspicua]TWT70707.1 hypothetical protein Pan14r_30140 [Crateriforma conspicua]